MSAGLTRFVGVDGVQIAVTTIGEGPGLLLLHGFPESKRMWRRLLPILSSRFSVVAADLRGYGDSSTPPSGTDHRPYSKRTMAREMVQVMSRLGHETFSVAGHDRGGRVAYRMALDFPDTVRRLAVLDVLPVDVVWAEADERMGLAFWPWTLLAQAEPLPEAMLTAAAPTVIEHALSQQWGTPAATFDVDDRRAYTDMLRDRAHAHAICEEYRAAATVDRDDDTADRSEGRRISCPVLALWSESGPLNDWYTHLGGPLELWRALAGDVVGGPVAGGHFFPEQHPTETAQALTAFFAPAEI